MQTPIFDAFTYFLPEGLVDFGNHRKIPLSFIKPAHYHLPAHWFLYSAVPVFLPF